MINFKAIFSNENHYKVVERCRLVTLNCGLFLVGHGVIEIAFGIRAVPADWLIAVIITGLASMLAYMVGLIMLKLNGHDNNRAAN